MNEQELRDGLRGEMQVASSQPPMNVNSALDQARRAHKHRRARWAGAGAGLAVVALAAGAVLTMGRPDGGGTLQIEAANSLQQTSPAPADQTKPSFPNGQQDRTATSGPHAARGSQLLQTLTAAIPNTVTVVAAINGSQAQFEDRVGDKESWTYSAVAGVTKAGANGVGRVLVETRNPGDQSADVCTVAKQFWGVNGTCVVTQVQGKPVGVVAKTDDPRIDQVAAYRYEDGTTVVVAQSKDPDNDRGMRVTGPKNGGLAAAPLTVDELTLLALNPGFKLG
ncbi:MAG: hypothetical protein ABW215_02820 [Kibdelosporangium sp.]